MTGYLISTNLETGIQHEKLGIPCQDYVSCVTTEKSMILADSDGHSDRRCFRAHKGSELACQAVEQVLGSYNGREEVLKREILAAPDLFLGQIERAVIARWNKLVKEDWEANLLSEEELKIIRANCGENWKENLRMNGSEFRRRAYGANLVFGMVMEDFWFASQNGDGTCVVVYPNGVYEKPIPADPEGNIANFSTSLCDRKASETFRHSFGREHLAAMFLCSDGIGDNTKPGVLNDMIFHIGYCTAQTNPEMERALKDQINTKWRNCDDISFCAVFDENLKDFVEAKPTRDDVTAKKEHLDHAEETCNEQLQFAEGKLKACQERIKEMEARILEYQEEIKKLEAEISEAREEENMWCVGTMDAEQYKTRILHAKECWKNWKENVFSFWDAWENRECEWK